MTQPVALPDAAPSEDPAREAVLQRKLAEVVVHRDLPHAREIAAELDAMKVRHRLFVPPERWAARIVLAMIKGGVAKTTTAVFMAISLARWGRTLLVDCDPDSQTAISWASRYRELTGEEFPVTVIQYTAGNLAADVNRYAREIGAEHVVVDVGGKGDAHFRSGVRWVAQNQGDLILPVRPSPAEIERIGPSMVAADEVRAEGGDAWEVYPHILLSQCTGGQMRNGVWNPGRKVRETREAFEGEGWPVMATEVPLLDAYSYDGHGTAPDDCGHFEDALTEMAYEEAQAA